MAMAGVTPMSNAVTDILPDTRRDEVAVTVLKFLIAFIAGAVLYGVGVVIFSLLGELAVEGLGSPDGKVSEDLIEVGRELADFIWKQRAYALMMILPAIPTALMFLQLPEETVDRYHRFGKAFAMFLTVNLTLSGMFLFHEYHMTATPPDLDVFNIIFWFSIASAFLPGPYIGILLGSRWSR